MFRLFFLGFLLFSSPLYAQTSPEQALDAILNAPWGKSPAGLADRESWTVEPFTIINHFDWHGYNLQAFAKSENSLKWKLFSYAEPSLSSSNEVILMGLAQMTAPTEEEAAPILEKMAAYMKSRGFVESAPDSIYRTNPKDKNYKNFAFLKKGDLRALVYLVKDFKGYKDWFGRTIVYLSSFKEFRNGLIGEWQDGRWYSMYKMPKRLLSELEEKNISYILGAAQWDKIKSFSKAGRDYSQSPPDETSVRELIVAYETVDKMTFPDNDKPAILLFKNYLVRYMFDKGVEKTITVEQKEWLKSRGLEYTRNELGRVYHYTETILQNIVKEYKGSYWGQFAFLELLEMGFDTSGTCRGRYDQWEEVLKEGYVFLEKYPNSEFAPDIRFYMGLAAETLFNMGTIKDSALLADSGLSWTEFADKSKEAQKNAIFFYEQVLRTPQKAAYQDYLKYNLPRLRAGFATGSRYYFCYYD